MKISWNNIIDIGIDRAVKVSEIRYIHLLNILAIVVSLFELIYMAIFAWFFPHTFLLLLGTLIGVLNLGVLLLNYFKHYLFARVFFGLLALIFITIYSFFLGPETLMQIYLLESIIIAFFIYPPKERIYRNIMIFLMVGAFLGLEIWFSEHLSIIKNIPIEITYGVTSGLLILMIAISFYIYTIINYAEIRLKQEQRRSEKLLLNVLPKIIANRLKETPGRIADHYDEVTILFSDIVNFTHMIKSMTADDVVSMLNELFTEFDHLAEKYGLEKIKTMGDAYMVVGGIPVPRPDHCEAIADMALSIQAFIHKKFSKEYKDFKLRMGIHIGPVVAGVIGKKKFTYDLWGDSVNLASRMEYLSVEDKIQVTEQVYHKLKDRYEFEYRGKIDVKGIGRIDTYYLLHKN